MRTLFSSIVLALACLCAAPAALMAAEPAYSGDDALAAPADGTGTGEAPLSGENPASARFSYAPGLEKQLEEIIAATEKLERGLAASERQLQSLHTAEELAALLLRNPDGKIHLDKSRVAEDGSHLLQWEQAGEEVYQELTERGVAASRLQWKGLGAAPLQQR